MSERQNFQVRVENVSKTYGDHHVNALNNISLDIVAGEFVALMGPSGCGKSTLLNLIGCIDRPTSGRIWFEDQDVTSQSDDQITRMRGKNIGFIFQFFNLLSTMTVIENVELPLELARINDRDCRRKAAELLARVGMEGRSSFYPSQLSGGEMQRTAIARALIHRPKLILADEPTGNLDSENGKAVLELLSSINSEFRPTIVMATHSQEAAAYAQRVIEMRDGIIFGDKQKCSLN